MSLQSHQIVDQRQPSSSLLQGVPMGRRGNLEADGRSFPVVDRVSVGSSDIDQKSVVHHHIHHIHHHQPVEDAHSTTTSAPVPVFWPQTYASDQYNNLQNFDLQENLLEMDSELMQHAMFQTENDYQMSALMVGSEMNMVGNGNTYMQPNHQMSQSMNGISIHQSSYINSDQVAQTPAQLMPSSADGGNVSNGGTTVKPKTRAKRGQATDPHSIAERLRREKISERMKNLQELVPNSNKTDKASMLDEIIDYVKFLQLQVKVLSMSRLGGAGAVVPFISGIQSEEVVESYDLGELDEDSSKYEDEAMAFEEEVVKLLDSDISSAMQYLQTKGLCLMPTSIASAISNRKGSSASIVPPGRKKPDGDDDDDN